MGHLKLPWEKSLPRNFVPNCIRFLRINTGSVFIAWRKTECIILTFSEHFVNSAAVPPKACQVLRTSETVLDVLSVNNSVYFVSVQGSVQHLHLISDRSMEKDKYRLVDVYQFSSMKNVLSVCGISNKNNSDSSGKVAHFCAVTCGKENSELNVELYAICRKPQFKVDFELVFVRTIPHIASHEPKMRATTVFHCPGQQVKALFPEFHECEILLLGLSSGHLYCIPFNTSVCKFPATPTLVYQSSMPICGLSCPSDGDVIFLAIDGGVFVIISSASNQTGGSNTPLSFKTITLPSSMKHICAAGSGKNLILCSNGVDLWQFQPLSSDSLNTMALKGVKALCAVEGTNLVLTATLHCVFYELNLSSGQQTLSQENKIINSLVWSGVNLDKPLQYVREMKEQTEFLARLRMEQEKEDSIISALSTAARAHLLTEFFSMSVKVDSVCQSPDSISLGEPYLFASSNLKREYCFQIEIRNNSSEEFALSMWGINIEIENPSGKVVSRFETLQRTFSVGAIFATALTISLLPKEVCFPMKVNAFLMSVLAAENDTFHSHWLTISVGSVTVDISYFINIFTQEPTVFSSVETDVSKLIEQLNLNSTSSTIDGGKIKDTSKLTHTISIPESARQTSVIVSKLLENCQHRIDKSTIEKHLNEQYLDSSVWVGVNQSFVQLTLKKACTSLSVSSENAELLHQIKSWIVAILLSINKERYISNSTIVNAKKLKAVLEMENFEESESSSRNLLSVYQELRSTSSA